MTVTTTATQPTAATTVSRTRLTMLRAAYLFIGLGLAIVKWPLLPDAHTLPLYESVTLCLLTAMSLLAFAGLLRPLRMLPLLVFETTWKLLWLGLVALPNAVAGDLDSDSTTVTVNCSLVVLVIALTPWTLVRRQLVSGNTTQRLSRVRHGRQGRQRHDRPESK
jgi:hypothetical protein